MTNDSNNLSSIKEKADLLCEQGLLEQALLVYDGIKRFAEQDPSIYSRLGDLFARLGKTEDAIESYRQAAMAFARYGEIVNAIAASKAIIHLDPRRVEVLDQLLDIYLKKKDKVSNVTEPATETCALTEDESSPAPMGSTITLREEDDNESFPKTPLFSDLPRLELTEIINAATRANFAKGEYVFKTNDEGRSIFVITSGRASVLSRDAEGNDIQCATLKKGDFFGEFGYFSGEPRVASVMAETDLELLELTRQKLKLLTSYHHNIGKVLVEFYKDRVLERFLAVSSVFKHLTAQDRRDVLDRVDAEVYADGMDIICEGDKGEEMYLIKMGSVEVWTTAENHGRKIIATLKDGDSFGHFALILDYVRRANITALTPVELVVFPKKVIEEILCKYPTIKEHIAKEAHEKLAGIETLRPKLPPSLT